MKRQLAVGLKEGDRIDSVFALRSKQLRAARTGEAYLSLEFADRSGRIAGVMFRPPRDAQDVPAGAVVGVCGVVTTFRGSTRVSVESMRPAKRFDARDLMPMSDRDQDELLASLRELVGSVRDPGLKAVLRGVFGQRSFMARFRQCPASASYHHACAGGLLEHTVDVATLCRELSRLYPSIDADLLIAGALLHDIGKVDELAYDVAIDYTDEGRLLGHVVLGERRVRRAVEACGERVPPEVAMCLSHVVLAHHGELEWGAPKRPSSLEALILHHADNLDAKAVGFIEASKSASRVDEPWTDGGNLFRRPLYVPRAVEDDRVREPQDDDHYQRIA